MSVSVTSALTTKPSMEYFKSFDPIYILAPKAILKLHYVPYISYLIQVKQQSVEVLINSNSEVNAMNRNFAKKLGIQRCKTKIGAQKIDELKLDTFGMVIVFLSIEDKERKSCFFQETFLLADIRIEIDLDISFLTLKNIEINFIDCYIC